MVDEKFTRCPGCGTVFRVTQAQLDLREGKVRCGQCQAVFDGVAELVAVAPRAAAGEDAGMVEEAAPGPPTVTPHDAQALEPAPDAVAAEPASRAAPEDAGVAEAPDGEAAQFAPVRLRPEDLAPPRVPRRPWAAPAYAVASALLLVALGAQAAFHYRDVLVARWPELRPVATAACAAVGCRVGAPRDAADLAILASDLQADPAHQGLLILTATLRNKGSLALAYPYLELTLTDAQDQVVARRALAPREYAGGTVDLARGIPPYGEIAVKLFIDASATTQAGYRLYLFYA